MHLGRLVCGAVDSNWNGEENRSGGREEEVLFTSTGMICVVSGRPL